MNRPRQNPIATWLLAAALLAGAPLTLNAQGLPGDAAPAASTARAFELEIRAPDEMRGVLERHLELLRYRELTDLDDSELTRLLTAARQDVQQLAAALGYFSPDIRLQLQSPDPSPAGRTVTLSVSPGEPTLVREVRLEFSGPIAHDPAARLQRQQIERLWQLPPGQRFTQAGWDAAKQQALRQLTSQHYPTATLAASLADIDPASQSARLALTLDSGPAYRLGELFISGLRQQDAVLVTRLARLTPGTSYEQAQLVAAQQRLTDSGYFDSAFVALDTAGDPGAAPVRVQLREAPRQKLVFGLGASTDSGARLSLEHTHHKVPGLGWRAVSTLRLDRETRALGTELTAPPDADNWRWITSVLFQQQAVGSADVRSQRWRMGRGQSGAQTDRNYYIQYDRSRPATTPDAVTGVAQAISVNYAVIRRQFDSLPFPSRGWGAGLEVGGGSTLGRQPQPYGRVLARWLSYHPLQRSSDATQAHAGRLALRAEAGAVLAREDLALPSSQLFLTGGDSSVRGYGYRDIGVTRPDGQTTAGRYLTIGSLEWQQPIRVNGRLSDWEGTLFMDAGAVADRPHELHARVGLGAGVRWKSPIGPLQIDLAYGVALKRLRLHLNVGFAF